MTSNENNILSLFISNLFDSSVEYAIDFFDCFSIVSIEKNYFIGNVMVSNLSFDFIIFQYLC